MTTFQFLLRNETYIVLIAYSFVIAFFWQITQVVNLKMIDTNAPISNKFNHCSLAVGGKHFVSPVEKHVLHFGCVPLYPSFLQLVCELFLLRQFHLSTEVVMFSRLYVELFIQFSWRNIQTDHLLYLSSDDIIRSLEQNGKLLHKLAILF